MRFTKKAVDGQCRATRCLESEGLEGFHKGERPVHERSDIELWDGRDPTVFLCPKHLDQARAEETDSVLEAAAPELLTDIDEATGKTIYSTDGGPWSFEKPGAAPEPGAFIEAVDEATGKPIYSTDDTNWSFEKPGVAPIPEPKFAPTELPAAILDAAQAELAKEQKPFVEAKFTRNVTIVEVDHAPVLALVTPIRDQCTKVSAELVGIVIDSQAAYNTAAALGAGVQGQLTKLEKKRKEIVQPLLEGQREINALFKMASEPGAKVKQLVKTALGEYTKRLQAEKLAQLQAGNHQEALAVPEVVQPAGTYTKATWKYRVVDEALVPRKFLMLDTTAINAVVQRDKDQTNIPGIDSYLDEQVILNGER